MLREMIDNRMLIAGLSAWMLAQMLKAPFSYLFTRRWNWASMFDSGGMPSSHSALMSSTTLSIGLFSGFDSAAFAIAMAITMVVIYDAAGVRRQAGIHAERINLLLRELFSGHPVSQEFLKEVIGHTPRQVIGGVLLGLAVATITWLIFS